MATIDDRTDERRRSGQPPATVDRPRHPWLSENLRRRLRFSPRLGRLVAAIDLFAPEMEALKTRDAASATDADPTWHAIADQHLAAARDAANQRRLDDGWDFLHGAQRQSLLALTRPEVESAAAALDRECSAKLGGWRGEAAAANLAMVKQALETTTEEPDPARAPDAAYVALTRAQLTLDENTQNAYLRLRLVGQRLLLATVLLVALLVGLGAVVAADGLGQGRLADVTVLHELGTYVTIALLGMLGALLSFSLGTLRSEGSDRIYELVNGRYAGTLARILVGGAAAVVVAIAVQSGIVALNPEWLLILAVAAGFSERLVRRIVESLSADAEKPREPTPDAGRTP